LQKGAAQRLEAQLNQRDVESGTSSRSSGTFIASFLAFVSYGIWYSANSRGDGEDDQSQDNDDRAEDPSRPPDADQPLNRPTNNNEIFLLLCNRKKTITKLLQPNISQVKTDEELFELMRREYKSLCCNPWWSLVSFRTLTGFKFVKLKLWKRKQEVEIIKKDDMPPLEKVGCEYQYAPAPPELIPSVGEKRLLHLFHHPDCAEEELDIFHLIPKKIMGRLPVSSQGWGIYPEEGWNQKKLWIVGFIVFAMGSAVFGILWAIYRSGIHDAFAIASYAITFGVLTIGFVQAICGNFDKGLG
jgi:hypothetical protein